MPAAHLDATPAADAVEITYNAAVSGVIARWLERDPEAFVLGEEVGHLGGGVFGLTKGALAIAPERVLSTPICENGFSGAAFGAALLGMHPIVEFMYPDFALEAADQLFNHIPKARYMYGGTHEVPAHRADPGQPRTRLRAPARVRPGRHVLDLPRLEDRLAVHRRRVRRACSTRRCLAATRSWSSMTTGS